MTSAEGFASTAQSTQFCSPRFTADVQRQPSVVHPCDNKDRKVISGERQYLAFVVTFNASVKTAQEESHCQNTMSGSSSTSYCLNKGLTTVVWRGKMKLSRKGLLGTIAITFNKTQWISFDIVGLKKGTTLRNPQKRKCCLSR